MTTPSPCLYRHPETGRCCRGLCRHQAQPCPGSCDLRRTEAEVRADHPLTVEHDGDTTIVRGR